jgi:hypothetical protein
VREATLYTATGGERKNKTNRTKNKSTEIIEKETQSARVMVMVPTLAPI